MINEALIHLETILTIVEKECNDYSPVYIKELEEFVAKFRHFKPEVYIYIEDGTLHYVASNSNTVVNIFDVDNEKDFDDYKDKKEEWDYMIQSGITNGLLKNVY